MFDSLPRVVVFHGYEYGCFLLCLANCSCLERKWGFVFLKSEYLQISLYLTLQAMFVANVVFS